MSSHNDALKHDVPLVQIPFFADVLSRYPTTTSILDPLKRLGHPKSSLDISYPDSKTVNAVDIICALACHVQLRGASTASFINRHWQSFIGRWYKFLLERYILVDAESSPHTPEGASMAEHIMLGCSVLLLFPEETPDAQVKLTRCSPWLQALLIQVWLKAIDTTHRSWGNWDIPIGMIGVMRAAASANGHPDADLPTALHASTPRLYTVTDREVGAILARHAMYLAHRVPQMTLPQLSHLKLFMMINMNSAFFDDTIPTLEYKNLQYFTPAFVYMMRTLLHQRKSLKKARPQSKECVDAFPIVTTMMIFFSEELVHDPNRVRDMLKGGLLEAFFQAYPFYFTMQNTHGTAESFGDCGVIRGLWCESYRANIDVSGLRNCAQGVRSSRGRYPGEPEVRGGRYAIQVGRYLGGLAESED